MKIQPLSRESDYEATDSRPAVLRPGGTACPEPQHSEEKSLVRYTLPSRLVR
jgi:hypothetical protein